MKKTIRTLRSMGFKAASKGDQAFADMHPVQVVDAHDDKVSKTLNDIAKAKGVIPYDRVANKHGYRKGEDEAAYDAFKHNAGGPVVAPVYTKSMYEGVRSCTHCGGTACEQCGETGFELLGEEEHSNAVVRILRREMLNEGPRLRALGKTIKDTADFAVGGVLATGAATAAGYGMGNAKLGAIVGGLTSAAMVGSDARQNWKRNKRNELAQDKMLKAQKAQFPRVSEETEVTEGKRLKALGRAIKDEGPEMMKHMGVQVAGTGGLGAILGGKTLAATGAAIGVGTALYAGAKDIKRAYKFHKATMGEETEVNEGMRLIKTFTQGPHSAKVYKDSDWGEHRVQFFKNGKHLKKADSHHDDKADAFGTAQHQLKRMCEDVELDEGLSAAHNALQDKIRGIAASLPGRMKTAASQMKAKAAATYNDLEDKYQGGPQRRAMQLSKAVAAKKDQQVARISGKATGYENKAKDLSSYASQSLAKADAARRAAGQVQVPNHNLHQVTTTDDYERKKGEIATATAQKSKLAADAEAHQNKGLSYFDNADAAAARSARIKNRLDAALSGKSKLLGRGKPKPTAFQTRLKKTVKGA